MYVSITFWNSAKDRFWLAPAIAFIDSISLPAYLSANLPVIKLLTSSALEKKNILSKNQAEFKKNNYALIIILHMSIYLRAIIAFGLSIES